MSLYNRIKNNMGWVPSGATLDTKEANSTNKPVYFKNLDGLRFFAFLIVFISHAALFLGYNNNSPIFNSIIKYFLINGDIGVSFFFVLSGFLITYLLFREQDISGKISWKNFYAKRILRIWPVYFITILLGFFILPIAVRLFIGNIPFVFPVNPSLTLLPQYMLFLANFNLAFTGGSSVPTNVLWSISVEEQFYLIWPLVMIFLPRKHILKALGLIIVTSCVYRYFNALLPNVILYSTFSVMSDLAIGSMLSYFVYTKNNIIERLRHTPRKIIVGVYVFLLLIVLGRHYITYIVSESSILYNLFIAIFPLVLATTFAFVILEQNEMSRSLFKIGKSKIFSFLGRISYGLYSYHIFAFTIILLGAFAFGFDLNYTSTLQLLVFSLLSLITVFVIAVISYYGMEKPFLDKKPKTNIF